MPISDTNESLRQYAETLGFEAFGVVRAGASVHYDEFLQWLQAGWNAGMAYMQTRSSAFSHPRFVLPEVQSIVMLGMAYPPASEEFFTKTPSDKSQIVCGQIARYAASGRDYHEEIRPKIRLFQAFLKTFFPDSVSRGVVDTAPFPEREWARRAGIGFLGRNRMLIHPVLGSHLFLAAVLTSAELPEYHAFPEAFLEQQETACQNCGRCWAACPTGALSEKGLDARRCVSYWTIEHRGPIPETIRSLCGDRLFGCDACTEVCPHNAGRQTESVFLEIASFQTCNDAEFTARFAHTPFQRSGREGLERNVAMVMENQNVSKSE